MLALVSTIKEKHSPDRMLNEALKASKSKLNMDQIKLIWPEAEEYARTLTHYLTCHLNDIVTNKPLLHICIRRGVCVTKCRIDHMLGLADKETISEVFITESLMPIPVILNYSFRNALTSETWNPYTQYLGHWLEEHPEFILEKNVKIPTATESRSFRETLRKGMFGSF